MMRIFAFLVCTLLLAGSSNAELVVSKEKIEPVIGDFFQYEMIGTSLPDGIGNNVDEENYLRVENYDGNGFRMEITGQGETEFEGKTVDYYVMMSTWETSFTLYYDDFMEDGDGKEDAQHISIIRKQENWILDEGNLNPLNSTYIKVADSNYLYINWTINDYEEQDILLGEYITETETETLSTSGAKPENVKVGSMWTTSTTEKVDGTDRSWFCEEGKEADCEWDVEEIDVEMTSTSTQEALREVEVTTSAGTYEALEIKEIDEGDGGGNYTLTYVSEKGIPVKTTSYEDDLVSMNMQLESYHISVWETASGDDEDESALGVPALPFLLSITTIVLIASRKRLH